jgi:nicotinamidase-related amidase
LLRNNNINQLFLMGYALQECVESFLRSGHDLGYESRVISDACAAFTQVQEDYFNNQIAHRFGESISTQQFLTGKY